MARSPGSEAGATPTASPTISLAPSGSGERDLRVVDLGMADLASPNAVTAVPALPGQHELIVPGPGVVDPDSLQTSTLGTSTLRTPTLGKATPAGQPLTEGPKRPWRLFLVACDALSLIVSFALGALVRVPLGSREGPTSLRSSLSHEVPYLVLYILAFGGYGLYHRGRRRLRTTSFLDLGALAHGLVVGSIATMAASALAFRLFGTVRVGWVEAIFMVTPAMAVVPAMRAAGAWLLRRRGVVRSRVIVVGSGAVASTVTSRLQRCADVEVVGFIDDDPYSTARQVPSTWLGSISQLSEACARYGVDRVLVAFSASEPAWIMEMLRQLPPSVRISIVPRLFELVTWQSQIEELHGLTVMDVAPPRLDALSRAMKRAMDISVSLVLLTIFSPLLLPVAAAIKATSPGPIFFRQPRAGRNGKAFRIFKFRTMALGAEDMKIDLRDHNEVDGPLFKMRRDPRVTPIGAWLRKTSLDEVPQLLNVLLGQMSLVGPRPFVLDESAEIDGWAARRFDVRPGMTGLWQVSGRNDLPFEELRQLDYAYVASWSLSWDMKILWHTPASVLRGQGAY
jgi:exopolysaccharide biosynthesis polyprenyl glycosylphosphotransferase